MIRWLSRRIAVSGPYLVLCLSKKEQNAVFRYCKVSGEASFVSSGADATTHFLEREGRTETAVVCLQGFLGLPPIEVVGLLVHEAVHIWQHYAESIGEKLPGVEQEAYGIQIIAQELCSEFARRMEKGDYDLPA